jgi:acetyl/propionyl-CoA carboxylase alpha subunit
LRLGVIKTVAHLGRKAFSCVQVLPCTVVQGGRSLQDRARPHLERTSWRSKAYLSIDEIIRVAMHCGADAIHPGYGLLSESPEFVEACEAKPASPSSARSRNHAHARQQGGRAQSGHRAGVPVVPATDPLPDDMARLRRMAAEIGYPVMLKASWGGGGRGMRVIRIRGEIEREVLEAKREAKAAFGKDEVYLEKLVERARHVEVQILGDKHGNGRSTCSSATARSSGATRRSWSARPRPISTTNKRRALRLRPAIGRHATITMAPARSSS